MKKVLLLSIIIITSMIVPYSNIFAVESGQNTMVSNSITPVSYFVNHVKQLGNIEENLNKYKKTSLVGCHC